ncbi:MAG TPA: sirohydrochlorin cobaltochelatase [Desulfobacterales bacterium]|nr:sirohydrochlorin cobaltochelatase [Desulfobacterales bacterium]
MKKVGIVVCFVLAICFGWVCQGYSRHGEKRAVKKAVLLVAFGTSIPRAQKVFDYIDKAVKKEFPGVEVRWAFTSRLIRKKLAGQGKFLDSPLLALSRLLEDGYTHVAVLSLHIIPGEEFHDLYVNAHKFTEMEEGFERLVVARPLLSSHDDLVRVARAMIKHFPEDRTKRDAVVLMGHGTAHHPSDFTYMAFNYLFWELDPLVFVGTVEGKPTVNDLLPKLKAAKVKKVYLIPFMSVAGDHAINDMAGDEPDSWKSIIEKAGIKAVPILKGLGEYPEVVAVWVDHLKRAFSHLD